MPFLLLLCALSLSIFARTTDELIAQAHSQQLSESRYWHLLMHTPKKESEIDDETFFLAPNGKYNIDQELEATIRHFNDDANRSDESVFCRFPARRAWLEHELNVSFGAGECVQYDALITKLDPQKVTLVFPTAHINSPASMFGHTFLRIDSSMESKLMSQAINYAAFTEETNGLLFAYKGLFGGYYGFYSMLPYYEKLKEYRDTESRDVWEYDLNFTHDEVMAMVRHIWELQKINSWYYFFDENCSYHMLWLSEIARPSVHLRDHFFYYVIPPETIRAFEEEGLVAEKHYRPSKRTKLLAYEKVLSLKGKKAALALSSGETDADSFLAEAMSDQERRYVYEAAAELTEYAYIEGKMNKELYASRYHAILRERASLGPGETLPLSQKANPDIAHRALRVELAKEWRNARTPMLLGWRPALHDLSEDDTGQLAGAQIEFLDTLVGLEGDKLSLEKLTILSLSSITPVSYFFKPLSWRMKSGWDREYGSDRSSFVTRVGVGSSIGDDQLYGYLLTEPEVRLGFNADAGLGFTAGAAANWGYRMKTLFELGHVFYIDAHESNRALISHQWQWNTWGSFFGSYETIRQERRENNFKLGINLYF